ncbi:MAG: tyrosine-type recombinase/integrase [Syntrophobacteraceae bacterium]
MITPFRSLLAKDIESYLNYKRAIGRKFHTEAGALHLLDRFLHESAIEDHAALSPSLIDSFLASRPRSRPRSFNHLLSVLRCFFSWLVCQGRLAPSPVRTRPRPSSRRLPFLFKPEEVCRLLKAAVQLPDNSRASHRGDVYSLIFRLMYSLGLRVGETTRLCHRDVDRDRRLLVIRETKFGKSRLVPFGPKVGEHIEAYLAQRITWYGPWQPEDPLFSFRNGHKAPLCPETVSQTFHHLLSKLGLRASPDTASPCLHCLRHSFAVQTLLGWYRSDIDPGKRLLHLSTFMGHSDPASTSWYLTITDELLAEANQRFEHLVETLSCEVSL